MQSPRVKGGFAVGGVTAMTVQMLRAGLFNCIFDVQCFDLEAIRSYRENANHRCMSASHYSNPWNCATVTRPLRYRCTAVRDVLRTPTDVHFATGSTASRNGRCAHIPSFSQETRYLVVSVIPVSATTTSVLEVLRSHTM